VLREIDRQYAALGQLGQLGISDRGNYSLPGSTWVQLVFKQKARLLSRAIVSV
jgi:hypothetical protein